jgi:hypothetical protein
MRTGPWNYAEPAVQTCPVSRPRRFCLLAPVWPLGAGVSGKRQRAEQQYGNMWLCSLLVEADPARPGVTA